MKKTGIRSTLFAVALCLLFVGKSDGTENWMNRGFHLLKARQFAAAIEAFTRAIEADPGNAEAYNQRGVARANSGDFQLAIADYTKAADIKPKQASIFNNRGSAYYHTGAYERAIADYTRAIEINPYLAALYSNRGTAWVGKGDYFHAITDYTQSVELNPYFDVAYFNRGKTLFAIGDYNKAIGDFTKAIDINPTFDDAYNQLATIWAHCPDQKYRDGARAVKMAKKAVEMNPTPEFLNTLASAHAEAGQFEEAVSVQRRAVELLRQQGKSARLVEFRKRLTAYAADTRMTPNTVMPHEGKVYKKAQPPKKRYVVQAGAFLSRQNAEERKTFLTRKGYEAAVVTLTDAKGRRWHTVRIGNYTRKKDALTEAADLSKNEKLATNVRLQNAL